MTNGYQLPMYLELDQTDKTILLAALFLLEQNSTNSEETGKIHRLRQKIESIDESSQVVTYEGGFSFLGEEE
jgi:hypothetical protein